MGTLVVMSPVFIAAGAVAIYHTDFSTKREVEVEVVEVETPKVDTVVIVKEVAPVAPPAPVVKKPTPPPAPAPEPPKVVKDTVIEKVAAELDTTK